MGAESFNAVEAPRETRPYASQTWPAEAYGTRGKVGTSKKVKARRKRERQARRKNR